MDEQRWIQLICRGASRKEGLPRGCGSGSLCGSGRSDISSRRSSNIGFYYFSRLLRHGIREEVDNDDGMPPKAFGQCGALFADGRFLFVHGGVTQGNTTSLHAFQLDIAERLWTPLQLSKQLPSMWGSIAQTVRIPAPETHFASGVTKKCRRSLSSSKSAAAIFEENQEQQEEEKRRERQQQQKAGKKQSFVEVVVVFGGMQGNSALNDTYILYLTSPPPCYRRLHYADDEPRAVEKLPSLPSNFFPGRRRACSAVCKNYFIFVFGGRDADFFYNDLWVLNVCTRQWIMVREETPLQYMRDFFLKPFDFEPGVRIKTYVENVLKMRRDGVLCSKPTLIPYRCRHFNSSAVWRTGAVMVSRGVEIFILGGFTYDSHGALETHSDVHVYNFMHHVWREVEIISDCPLPPFPNGYFDEPTEPPLPLPPSSSSSLVCQCSAAAPEIAQRHDLTPGPQKECASSKNWDLVKNISSVSLKGRTMATMCADPVMPGFRFFLFGGRAEDEPNAELYDVRIYVDHAGLRANLWKKLQSTHWRADERQHDVAFSSTSATDELLQRRGRCFCWGERKLREQAADLIRAALLEAPRLCSTKGLLLRSDYTVVDENQIAQAQSVAVALKDKTNRVLPLQLRSVVMCSPTFLPKK